MLELDFNDVEKFKENLVGRKLTFRVERKRNEMAFLVNGKKIAKANQRNSVNTSANQNSKSILNIFATVKKSINKYLEKNNFEVEKKQKIYESSFLNRILFDELKNGTTFYYIDVKHCYWRIAFLNGYISESYYNKILKDPDMKLFRNMALSCIIAPRIMDYYKKGNFINTIQEDTQLYQDIYENIRFTAWNIFGKLCFEKIGKENTIGYFTDGIMVFEKDVNLVKTTLSRAKLQFKVVKCIKVKHKHYMNTDTSKVIRL
jgi:hypothetical protein